MQLEWSHAVVHVKDMEKMVDFYTRILGFQVTDRGEAAPGKWPGIVFLSQVDWDHHQLGFSLTREHSGPSNNVSHIAFRVKALGDVKSLIGTLNEDGQATGLSPICHGNTWSIYFQDPEENGIEIFCDTPFHVAQPQGKKWDPEASDEVLLDWVRENFRDEPEFSPKEAFYEKRRQELAGR